MHDFTVLLCSQDLGQHFTQSYGSLHSNRLDLVYIRVWKLPHCATYTYFYIPFQESRNTFYIGMAP
jgi:hypothetical protein